MNYRILYFFHGSHTAILAHAFTKENEIPEIDKKRARDRMKAYKADPENHTYYEEQVKP